MLNQGKLKIHFIIYTDVPNAVYYILIFILHYNLWTLMHQFRIITIAQTASTQTPVKAFVLPRVNIS